MAKQARRAFRRASGGQAVAVGPGPLPADGDTIARALGIIASVENESLREVAATIGQRQVQVMFGPLALYKGEGAG